MITATSIFASVALLLGLTMSPPAFNQITITVVSNNVPYNARLKTDWGFACVVQGLEKTILFDTGGNGNVLLANMEEVKIEPKQIDVVVLSHFHGDHTGGLSTFLEKNPNVRVYVLSSFPQRFLDEIEKFRATVISVNAPVTICESAYSTGEMGTTIKEQGLILETNKGLVVVTGCAHPGIVGMVQYATEWLKDDVYLVLGGFHLMGYDESRLREVTTKLKGLGVKKMAPSHCTGDEAIKQFREAWGRDFVHGGCGSVISVP